MNTLKGASGATFNMSPIAANVGCTYRLANSYALEFNDAIVRQMCPDYEVVETGELPPLCALPQGLNFSHRPECCSEESGATPWS